MEAQGQPDWQALALAACDALRSVTKAHSDALVIIGEASKKLHAQAVAYGFSDFEADATREPPLVRSCGHSANYPHSDCIHNTVDDLRCGGCGSAAYAECGCAG